MATLKNLLFNIKYKNGQKKKSLGTKKALKGQIKVQMKSKAKHFIYTVTLPFSS